MWATLDIYYKKNVMLFVNIWDAMSPTLICKV